MANLELKQLRENEIEQSALIAESTREMMAKVFKYKK
jgi:hypothetical protein